MGEGKERHEQTETMMTITANTTESTTATTATKSFTRHFTTTARIVLGFIFTVTGFNGFFQFLPQPTAPMPDGAMAFSVSLAETGYMLELTSGVQAITGLLLLAGRFVPLALALLAPVVVNIFLFHVFLAPEGLTIAIVVAALEIGLAWAYRDAFRPMLRATRG